MKIFKESKGGSALLLIVLAALIASVSSRKSFLVKDHHSAVQAPRVYAYDTVWKIFDSNGYELQVDNQIQDTVGWDFT